MAETVAGAESENHAKNLQAEINHLQAIRGELQWQVKELTSIIALTQDVIRSLYSLEAIASAYRQVYAAVNPDLAVTYSKRGDQLIVDHGTNQKNANLHEEVKARTAEIEHDVAQRRQAEEMNRRKRKLEKAISEISSHRLAASGGRCRKADPRKPGGSVGADTASLCRWETCGLSGFG